MKRLISKNYKDRYTYMLKVINSIGGRNLKYNWLITDIEAYPSDIEIANKIDDEYLFLSNDELLDLLEKENFQWIWATFSAIPNSIDKKDVLQYNLPSPDKVELGYKSEIKIQHPLAEIEIDCIDSSYFSIIFDDESIYNKLLKVYPNHFEAIDSPEDYFTSWNDRTYTLSFEFSYHPFNSFSSKLKNLTSIFKKENKKIHYEDSLYIYKEHFDFFIREYPYFDITCLRDGKRGTLNYTGMNNYYDKKTTKEILNKLKEQIPDHNKKIIKFLEKAVDEHDGFYIHGI